MKNKNCGECKHFVVSNYLDVCTVFCENYKTDSSACDYFEPKVITNGDRIRHMSDEELVKFLQKVKRCPPGECRSDKCESCWLQYIQEEAKDEQEMS